MHIVFKPALSETNHIPIDEPPALLNFTATLSVADYHELERDGSRVQLWSDIPFEGSPVPYHEWTSCDFGLKAAAGGIHLPSFQETSVGLLDDDDLPSPGTIILTLQLLVPPPGEDQRFSYTYRILHPGGEIKWLGEFGQNGTLVCEHTETILGLGTGWSRKEGMYVWTGRSIPTDIPVLRLANPDEYLAWTVGGKDGAFLAFLTTQRNSRLVSVPLEYIVCASPNSVMHVESEKTITVSGDGPLVMSSLPRQQSDLRLLKSMILQHCSPERVVATLLGEETEYLLITTRDMLPVQGITITTSNLVHSTPLSIPTNTLRSLLPSQTTSTFLLFAPHTFRAHLVTNVDTVTFTSPGPLLLSPAFNITSRVHVSILSPHKSAQLIEPTTGILPTPPPSPEWVPRSIIPGHHNSSHLYETTPENAALQSVNGENKADSSDTQNGSNTNENEADDSCGSDANENKADNSDTQNSNNTNDKIIKFSPRLNLRAVALQAKYLLSVALFVLMLAFKLVFGKSTPEYEGAKFKEEHIADDQPKTPESPVEIAVDANDAVDNSSSDTSREGAPMSRECVRPLGLAGDSTGDIDVPMPVVVEPRVSGILGPASEIPKSNSSRVLLVEVGESGMVRLAVWDSEAFGVFNAEMNGKRVPVSRMTGFAQQSRVEYCELAVDGGGILQVSYDQDKAAC
ncbi:hypothetical protein C0995_001697 [Termitomyces sp. Mi166|nr:hypothetical protein C0995_001697 [Termitomyces sp. Mi166\